MTVTKTSMLVMEATCDHCGKKESRTFIQGISPEGDVVFTDWIMFYLSVGFPTFSTAMAHPEKHACSEGCYTALCQKDYLAWEARTQPTK